MLKDNSECAHWIIAAAIDVHEVPGPGSLETTSNTGHMNARKTGFQPEYPLSLESLGVSPQLAANVTPAWQPTLLKESIKNFVL